MDNGLPKGGVTGRAPEPLAAGEDGAGGPGPATRSDVEELGPGMPVRWLVTTTGSYHLFDLDNRMYCREPQPGHGRFPYDGLAVALTRVERWPRIGGTFFIWVGDAEAPELVDHWHQSSTILSITRIVDDQPAPESTEA